VAFLEPVRLRADTTWSDPIIARKRDRAAARERVFAERLAGNLPHPHLLRHERRASTPLAAGPRTHTGHPGAARDAAQKACRRPAAGAPLIATS